MLWTVMTGHGVSDREFYELLNGSYELEDDDDVEAMLILWDEAASVKPSENERDYDEPEEWLEF